MGEVVGWSVEAAGRRVHGDVRSYNLSLMLRLITHSQRATKPELAAASGLSKVGVGRLMKDLVAMGLVRQAGAAPYAGTGRPATAYVINPDVVVQGIEVVTGHLRTVTIDLSGVVRYDSGPIDLPSPRPTPEQTVRLLSEQILTTREESRRRNLVVLAVGVAVPALVRNVDQVIRVSPSLGWRNVDLLSGIRDSLPSGPLVHLDTRANCAALAQLSDPALREEPLLVHLEVGASIGAGIVRRGELERGAEGYAGAIGHIPMLLNGPRCSCGRQGCLEALAGWDVLVRVALPDIDVARQSPSELGDILAERAGDGDVRTRRALSQVGKWLGIACASVVNLLNPSRISLGGYVPHLAPWLLPYVNETMSAHALTEEPSACQLTVSNYGALAPALGAAMLGVTSVLNSPPDARDVAEY